MKFIYSLTRPGETFQNLFFYLVTVSRKKLVKEINKSLNKRLDNQAGGIDKPMVTMSELNETSDSDSTIALVQMSYIRDKIFQKRNDFPAARVTTFFPMRFFANKVFFGWPNLYLFCSQLIFSMSNGALGLRRNKQKVG